VLLPDLHDGQAPQLSQLNAILSCHSLKDYDLSSLNRIYYAASPMPIELLRQGLEVFGPIFSQGYGLTESGPQISSLPRNPQGKILKKVIRKRYRTGK
jgi:acyl-CoA synthetase (AMP-forming)/AMP-acid ligase II